MTDQTGDGSRTPPRGRGASELSSSLAASGFEGAHEIGRGGFGVVYRCQQVSLGRAVAVKVLASDLDEPNRERFLREGYAMGRLSGHPNIVNILQVGVTEGGRPYIVMPYHAADSLAVRIRREGPLPWPEVLRIGVKLCGALETAHRSGTLHRDIKPANVLVDDYGEPQLTDFGIAHIAGGYETATGFFTGTIAYTAPEVLAGAKPATSADVYSLGATLYALIAGTAAYERRSGEELVAQYLRISSQPVPDLRAEGIPLNVCETIERAMAKDPADRPQTAAEFGKDLQAAQKRNGLKPDFMALSTEASAAEPTSSRPVFPAPPSQSSVPPAEPTVFTGRNPAVPQQSAPPAPPPPAPGTPPPVSAPQPLMGDPSGPPVLPADSPQVPPPPSPAPTTRGGASKKRSKMLLIGALAAVLLLVVVGGIAYFALRDGGTPGEDDPGTVEAQEDWASITNARVARAESATTQADGTIWIFGGRGDNGLSDRHEGYDPAIDSWKGGDNLPAPVMNSAAVTWRGNPVVLGGFTSAQTPTDKVWRVINARWVELPSMQEPRAAFAAAVIGDLIVVSGGIGTDGETLATTEVFNGAVWEPGPPMPTPRDHMAFASDGKSMFVIGGTSEGTDVATVERLDIVGQDGIWTPMPDMPQSASDAGATFADGRIVVAGGEQSGQVISTVNSLDVTSGTWSALPPMQTARHGLSLSAVGKSVYAFGGATSADDNRVTATAESLKLAPRKLQPAAEWRPIGDAQTARLQMAWAVADNRIWVIGGMRSGEYLQTVESFDPATGVWQTGPPLPIPLHHATATTYRGEVVVIGGSTENLAEASDRVFALRGESWVELPAMNHPRAAAAAAVVGDKLVVVGGQHDRQVVAPTEVFDGQSWSEAEAPPTPREHLGAVSDGKYVYTVGGRFLSSDKNSAAFERFDPESGEWERLPGMPTPRGSFGAAFIDGRIVAVGGEEPTRVLGTVESFDIAEGTWQELPWLTVPRHAEVVAAVGNTVYVIGGADRPSHEGPIVSVEALDFI